MVLASSQKWPFVINLGNSIIGVAVLAMPFCFKQCGILLGMLILLFCTWLTLASCQLLVKAGIMSHYQSYEYLAYHTYGAAGKLLVEMGMIGMQLGTLVAQIVVIGDLGPPIISHLFGFDNNWTTRLYLIIVLCLCVGLPLGLMKDLRNVSRASTICIMFYAVFSFYILWLSSGNLLTGKWYSHVNFWRPQGFFQCLPIMSFSFGCQTQLFILYDALPEPSLQAIKSIIHSAVNLCAVTYLLVGFFGYVTFYHLDIPGDIITVFPATLGTHLIKLGFVMSIAITFPVIIYPCRASIYTLLFQKDFMESFDWLDHSPTRSKHDIGTSSYIPEHLFKGITIAIVLGSMITGILIPNVEFVLGLNGAITGTLICYIFPALFFLRVSKPEGKTIAQIVLALGVAILLVSTFTTLYAQDKSHTAKDVQKAVQEAADRVKAANLPQDHIDMGNKMDAGVHVPKEKRNQDDGKGRLEPPYPFAPADNEKADGAKLDKNHAEGGKPVKKEPSSLKVDNRRQERKQKASTEEVKKNIKEKEKDENKEHKELQERLDVLENQQKKQEQLLQEQKVLIQELKEQEQPHKQNVAPTLKQEVPVQQQGAVHQGKGVPNQQQAAAQLSQDANGKQQFAVQQGQGIPNQQQGVIQRGQQKIIQQGEEIPAGQQQPVVQQDQAVVLQQGIIQQGQQISAQKVAAAHLDKGMLGQQQAVVQGQHIVQQDKALLGQQQGDVQQDKSVLGKQQGDVPQDKAVLGQQDVIQNQAMFGQQQGLVQQNKAALGQQQGVVQQNDVMFDQQGMVQQDKAVSGQQQVAVQQGQVVVQGQRKQGDDGQQPDIVQNIQQQQAVQNGAL